MVLVAIASNTCLQIPCNCFLASLAIADLGVGIVQNNSRYNTANLRVGIAQNNSRYNTADLGIGIIQHTIVGIILQTWG